MLKWKAEDISGVFLQTRFKIARNNGGGKKWQCVNPLPSLPLQDPLFSQGIQQGAPSPTYPNWFSFLTKLCPFWSIFRHHRGIFYPPFFLVNLQNHVILYVWDNPVKVRNSGLVCRWTWFCFNLIWGEPVYDYFYRRCHMLFCEHIIFLLLRSLSL